MNRLAPKTILYTVLAVAGFSTNALFARPALGGGHVGPALFSLVRLTAGAITLAPSAAAIGYAFWYAALRGLTATEGAIVQLSAPMAAALGAIVLLGEALNLRLIIAAPLILGGISTVFHNEKK